MGFPFHPAYSITFNATVEILVLTCRYVCSLSVFLSPSTVGK